MLGQKGNTFQSNPTLFARLCEEGVEEIVQDIPTTPQGRLYDHVIYSGMRLIHTRVEKGLADHYLIISEFEV